MKRRPNNHRSKHRDRRLYEGYRSRKDRTLKDRKVDKYGVTKLLEEDLSINANEGK